VTNEKRRYRRPTVAGTGKAKGTLENQSCKHQKVCDKKKRSFGETGNPLIRGEWGGDRKKKGTGLEYKLMGEKGK